jgi:hypothetical protein
MCYDESESGSEQGVEEVHEVEGAGGGEGHVFLARAIVVVGHTVRRGARGFMTTLSVVYPLGLI